MQTGHLSCNKQNAKTVDLAPDMVCNIKLIQIVSIKIETSTKMYTPFLSDKINDMDHMRISGTETSSVILNQTGSLKSWKWPVTSIRSVRE